MQVSLSTVYKDFLQADTDNSGTLSKQEIAQEALLLNDQGKTDEFQMFGTFLQGGTDGKGLFPDTYDANGKPGTDGELSMADLSHLAAADANLDGGSADSISTLDFQTQFGDQAGSGNTIDIGKLQDVAYPNQSNSSGNNSNLLSQLLQLLPFLSLFSRFCSPFGSPMQPPCYGAMPPYNQFMFPMARDNNPFGQSYNNGNSFSFGL